jgi:biotin operon repressor
MPNRRIETMEIREMLRLMQRNRSNRQIADILQINRKTVDKYAAWAKEQGLLQGELPSARELEGLLKQQFPVQSPPQNCSSVEPYRETVKKLRDQGVEIAAIRQRLIDNYDYPGSYAVNTELKCPRITGPF